MCLYEKPQPIPAQGKAAAAIGFMVGWLKLIRP